MAPNDKIHIIILIISWILSIKDIHGLRAVSVSVPLAVVPGDTVTLRCFYDLEGVTLYSVKWYKGKQEFFRYVLKEFPHISTFPLLGVNVEVGYSTSDKVVLRKVSKESSGIYRCEVSTEMPFYTEVVSSEMQVVYVPEGRPKITTDKRSYHMGDTLYTKCTSQPSTPPTNLTWILNGEKISESFIRHYSVKDDNVHNHTVTEIRTELRVISSIFLYGKSHLKCVASLFHLYNKEDEVVLRMLDQSIGSTELCCKDKWKYLTLPLLMSLLCLLK